jgi:phage repressor protein C with HTH and peptisase S24 domain
MVPQYLNGDLLACTLIKDVLFFQWGKIYVIDTSQGVLVKRIMRIEGDDEHVLLVSENKDKYEPFKFPTSDIRSLAIVVGLIRAE